VPSIPPRLVRTLSSIFIVALFIMALFPPATDNAVAETYVFDGTMTSTMHVVETNTVHVTGLNLAVSAPGYVTDMRAIAPNGADMDVTIILKAAKSSASSSSPRGRLPGPGVLAVISAFAAGALLRRKKKP